MSFVSIQEDGERDFVFSRGADELYKPDNKESVEMKKFDIFHFGSATGLLGGKLTETYDAFFDFAKKNGKLISFDPNFRDNLWAGREKEFIELSKKYIAKSDIVKVSDAEVCFITGISDVEDAALKLSKIGEKILLVTLGKKGTMIIFNNKITIIDSIKIKSVDSTGAGDAFVGALLYKIASSEENILDTEKKFLDAVKFSNVVGALTCTAMGAIEAIPHLDQALEYMK